MYDNNLYRTEFEIDNNAAINVINNSYLNKNFTIPSEVNSDTPLDILNLNWAEKDLPERERTKHVHRLHPYLGKYVPQLVEIFLRKFFLAGQRVYDPFVGSGTTLVQANELGINSVGCDISEFNTLLSKAKTDNYDVDLLEKEVIDILEKVYQQTTNANNELFYQKTKLKTINNAYLNLWFHENTLHELLTFRELIPNYTYQSLLRIIMSRSARSARLTTHHELDFPKKPQTEPYYCRKHSRNCQPINEAYKFLNRYGKDTVKRIEEFQKIRTNASVEVIHGDSRSVNIGEIDGVITSPPYVGLIDYHEQHRYSYELLELKDRSVDEIGSQSNGNSNKAKIDYVNKMTEVFLNCKKNLVRNGYMIIVANDKFDLYENIRKNLELKKEAVVYRHVNRRTGRRTKPFYETIFIWKKL